MSSSMSPVIAPVEMDWPTAMYRLLDGRKITRVAWNNEDVVYLSADWLSLRKGDGTLHQLIVSKADMAATDWLIVREQ